MILPATNLFGGVAKCIVLCCFVAAFLLPAGVLGQEQADFTKTAQNRAGIGMAALATIEGEASCRERIALRPGAVLEVELLDISRADAPSQRIASIRIRAQSQVPIAFTLHYDPAMIEPNRTYAITAKLILQGTVIFRSDTVHPVLTRGAGDTVEIMMVPIAAGDAAPSAPPGEAAAGASGDAAALVGPTWVAEDIGGGA